MGGLVSFGQILLLLAPAAGQEQVEDYNSTAAVQQAFEGALGDGDDARIARLLRSSENLLFYCFHDYAKAWLEEPAPAVIVKLNGLARGMQAAFGNGIYFELLERLQAYDEQQRGRWLEAYRTWVTHYERMPEEGVLVPLSQAKRVFEELQWLPGLMLSEWSLGRQYLQAGEHERALSRFEACAEYAVQSTWPLYVCMAREECGHALNTLQRYDEADRAYEEALESAVLVGKPRFLWTLQLIASHLCASGRHDAARKQFQRQLEALEPGDHGERSRVTLGLAGCSFHLGEDVRAVEHLTRAYAAPADELGAALGRGDSAAVERGVRADEVRAIEHFDAHAVQLARNAWRGMRDDDLVARAGFLAETIARVHGVRSPLDELASLATVEPEAAFDWLRGFAWTKLGGDSYVHADSAAAFVAWLERAYAVFDAERWPGRRAVVARHLGQCYEALAQSDRSIEYSAEAAHLFRRARDERQLVLALASQGRGHAALGDYPRAIAALEEALPAARRLGDVEGLALTLREYAACQVALGANARALAALEEALGLGRWNSLLRAKLVSEMGHVLSLMGQAERALPYLEESVRLHNGVGEPRDLTTALCRLAQCLIQLGRTAEAVENARRGLFRAERVPDSPILVANASNAFGLACAAAGDLPAALAHHRRALELQVSTGNHRDAAWTLAELAECHLAGGDAAEALAALEQCRSHLDRVGRRVLSEEGRSSFLAQWERVPALASAIAFELAERGAPDALARALPIVDAFLARTLIEGLQERADVAQRESNPELIAARDHALDTMASLRIACSRAAPDERAALEAKLGSAESRYEDLEQALRLANPALAELTSPGAISLASLQQEILGPEDVLLQFVLADEASFVWVISREAARVVRLAPRARIQAAYRRLAGALDPDGPRDASFAEPARELYELLLAPVEATAAHGQHWIVIPDDFLAFVPFDVLLAREPEPAASASEHAYVIRERLVTYAPSASFLAWSPAPRSGTEPSKDLLLVGDPAYPVEPVRSEALAMRPLASLRPERVRRLEKTRDEVCSIAGLLLGADEDELARTLVDPPRSARLSGSRFDLLLGAEATKSNLAASLTGHRGLHLAVHGYVDEEFPWFSGLVLSGEAGEPCSFLNLAEIADFELDAELVFLSACETARGESVKSEGIKNSARAFLLAGARAVVATQWTVGDEASARLARRFYEERFAGATAADALRRAKLALIELGLGPEGVTRGIGATRPEPAREEEARVHPAFWAPYVLWGHSR